MGSKKNVDMSATQDTVKVVEVEETQIADTKPKKVIEKVRSQKYTANRALVDKTKKYDTFAAIELIKKMSYSKFDGTLTADITVKDVGTAATITFPNETGKKIRVAIADEKLLKDIDAGKIEFDVLLAEPSFVPKVAKYARVLGPQGLMPSPKTGTITQDPQAKKKELESGKRTVKTERKAPLMHVTFGKVSMDTKQLVENFDALTSALKGKIKNVSISASMSPSVRVAI